MNKTTKSLISWSLCFSKGQREKDKKKIMKSNRKGLEEMKQRLNSLVKQKYKINSLETFSFVVCLIFMGPEDSISKYIISSERQP